MEHKDRLSELQIKEKYDAGHSSLPWDFLTPEKQLVKIDLQKIVESAHPGTTIKSLPPQILYHSIMMAGLENCVEALPYLSQEQLVRMMDYDAWKEDFLEPKKAFRWLKLFKKIGATGIATRYQALDEEYQIGLLQKFINIYSLEEFEKFSQPDQDSCIPLPGNEIYYQIKTDDQETVDFIKDLVESALALNVEYAFSLLNHAAYLPPNEPEFLLNQFRKARLEEDGFVSYDESSKIFLEIDADELKRKWMRGRNLNQAESTTTQLSEQVSQEKHFLDDVLFVAQQNKSLTEVDALNLQQGFLFLGNCLCAATKIEPDDLNGLGRVLEQAKALASLGLEYLSNGDETLALKVINSEYPKNLFRVGLSLIYGLQRNFLERLETLKISGIENLKKLQKQRRWGEIIWKLDTEYAQVFGFEETEALKGLFNRFPMVLSQKRDETTGIEKLVFKTISSVDRLNKLKYAVDLIIANLQK